MLNLTYLSVFNRNRARFKELKIYKTLMRNLLNCREHKSSAYYVLNKYYPNNIFHNRKLTFRVLHAVHHDFQF